MAFGRHDLTHSPVGLWQFNGDLLDSSGNGYDLQYFSGAFAYAEAYADILPGLLAYDVPLAGSSRAGAVLRTSLVVPSLNILGDLTLLAVVSRAETSTQGGWIAGSRGEWDLNSEAHNSLYSLRIDYPRNRLEYFAETGAGTDIRYTISTEVLGSAPSHYVMRRESNEVSFFVNGVQRGATSSGLAAPSGGTSARFCVGGVIDNFASSAASAREGFAGCISSLKVVASALSDVEILAEHNRCLGGEFLRVTP